LLKGHFTSNFEAKGNETIKKVKNVRYSSSRKKYMVPVLVYLNLKKNLILKYMQFDFI
jgi:hypothetical protein